jgi:hypothetical protein
LAARVRGQCEEAQRIDGDPAVAHHPVQVRPGHAAAGADAPDRLPGRHGVAHGHVLPAQVEVRAHETLAVIEVDHVARQVELLDQRDDASRGGVHGGTDGAGEVDARVPALDLPVELAAVPEPARDARSARPHDGVAP